MNSPKSSPGTPSPLVRDVHQHEHRGTYYLSLLTNVLLSRETYRRDIGRVDPGRFSIDPTPFSNRPRANRISQRAIGSLVNLPLSHPLAIPRSSAGNDLLLPRPLLAEFEPQRHTPGQGGPASPGQPTRSRCKTLGRAFSSTALRRWSKLTARPRESTACIPQPNSA